MIVSIQKDQKTWMPRSWKYIVKGLLIWSKFRIYSLIYSTRSLFIYLIILFLAIKFNKKFINNFEKKFLIKGKIIFKGKN